MKAVLEQVGATSTLCMNEILVRPLLPRSECSLVDAAPASHTSSVLEKAWPHPRIKTQQTNTLGSRYAWRDQSSFTLGIPYVGECYSPQPKSPPSNRTGTTAVMACWKRRAHHGQKIVPRQFQVPVGGVCLHSANRTAPPCQRHCCSFTFSVQKLLPSAGPTAAHACRGNRLTGSFPHDASFPNVGVKQPPNGHPRVIVREATIAI